MPELFTRIATYLGNNATTIATRGTVAIIIVLAAVFLGRVLSAGLLRILKRGPANKLAPIVGSITRSVMLIAGLLTALDQVGINVSTLLAGAGVAGLAVGFGAQALVKDIISGFFIIFDDMLNVGDTVKIGDAIGVVEDVGLRVTRVRSHSGQLWYIPNGSIATVANSSRGWTRATVEADLAYDQDVAKGIKLLQEVGDSYAKEHADLVVEKPEAHGVVAFRGGAMGVRLTLKVKAADPSETERELRKRLKDAFDTAKIGKPI